MTGAVTWPRTRWAARNKVEDGLAKFYFRLPPMGDRVIWGYELIHPLRIGIAVEISVQCSIPLSSNKDLFQGLGAVVWRWLESLNCRDSNRLCSSSSTGGDHVQASAAARNATRQFFLTGMSKAGDQRQPYASD